MGPGGWNEEMASKEKWHVFWVSEAGSLKSALAAGLCDKNTDTYIPKTRASRTEGQLGGKGPAEADCPLLANEQDF